MIHTGDVLTQQAVAPPHGNNVKPSQKHTRGIKPPTGVPGINYDRNTESTISHAPTPPICSHGKRTAFIKRYYPNRFTVYASHSLVHTPLGEEPRRTPPCSTGAVRLKPGLYYSDSVIRNPTPSPRRPPPAFTLLRRDVGYATQSTARWILYVDY